MIVQSILLSDESYTHKDWVYRDVCVGFSRLYYVIDGAAYYEENGEKRRLKQGHLYLTPVKHPFTLYDDPQNKLLHTYAHILTLPAVDRLIEIPVKENTPLADAVTLWRKYASGGNTELLINILNFLFSCAKKEQAVENTVALQAKRQIDKQCSFDFTIKEVSELIGYSREHITRSFLTAYAMTPKQYLNLRRMNEAMERIVEGAKIADVAEALHYASPYSFSKAFKKHYGLSPKKYLQELRRS